MQGRASGGGQPWARCGGKSSAHYARIRAALGRSGKPIGNMDLLIASHAVSQRMILITNNLRRFSHVPGLKAEVWS